MRETSIDVAQETNDKTIYSNSRQGVVLPREIVAWLHLLRLPRKIKLPKRDLANGYVIAHICSFYWPEVNLNGYRNGISKSIKRENWELLRKAFDRHSIPLSKKVMEGMIQSKDGYGESFLRQLYTLLTGKEINEAKPLRLPEVEAERYNPGTLAQQMKSTMEAYRHFTTEEEHQKRGVSPVDGDEKKLPTETAGGGRGALRSQPNSSPLHKLAPTSSSSISLVGRSASSYPSNVTKPIRSTYTSGEDTRPWMGGASPEEEGANHYGLLRTGVPNDDFAAEKSDGIDNEGRTGFKFTVDVRPSHYTSTVIQEPSSILPLEGRDTVGSLPSISHSSNSATPGTAAGLFVAASDFRSDKNSGLGRKGTLNSVALNSSGKTRSVKEWVEGTIKSFADDGWRLYSDCPTYVQFLLQHESDIDGGTQGSIWNVLISQIGYLVDLIRNQSEALKELLELMLVTSEAVRCVKSESVVVDRDRYLSMSSHSVVLPTPHCVPLSSPPDGTRRKSEKQHSFSETIHGVNMYGRADGSESMNPSFTHRGSAALNPNVLRTSSSSRRLNTPVVTSPRVFMFLAAALSHLTELDPHYALSGCSTTLLAFPTIQFVLRHLDHHLADMYASLFCALIPSDSETAVALLPDLLSSIYECITGTDSTPTAKMSYLILLQSMIRRLAQRSSFSSSSPSQHGSGGTVGSPFSSRPFSTLSPSRPLDSTFPSSVEGGKFKREGNRERKIPSEREEDDIQESESQRTSSQNSVSGAGSWRPTPQRRLPYSGKSEEGQTVGGGSSEESKNTHALSFTKHQGQFLAEARWNGGQSLSDGIHAIAAMHAVVSLSSEHPRMRMIGASLAVTLVQTGYSVYQSLRHFRNTLFPGLPSVLPFCLPRSPPSQLSTAPWSGGPGFSPLELVLRTTWLRVIMQRICTEDPSAGSAWRRDGSKSATPLPPTARRTPSVTLHSGKEKLQEEGGTGSISSSSHLQSSERRRREGRGGMIGSGRETTLMMTRNSNEEGMLEVPLGAHGTKLPYVPEAPTAEIIHDLLALFQRVTSLLQQPGGHRQSKGLVAFELGLSLPFLPLTRMTVSGSSLVVRSVKDFRTSSVTSSSNANHTESSERSVVPPTHTLPPTSIADDMASAVVSFFVHQCTPDMVASLVSPLTEPSYTTSRSNNGNTGNKGPQQDGGIRSDTSQIRASRNPGEDNSGSYASRVSSSPLYLPSHPASGFGVGGGGKPLDGRNVFLVDPLLGSFAVENMLCRTSSVLLCRALYKNVLPCTGDAKDAARRLGVRAATIARERSVSSDVRCRLDWLFWIVVSGRGLHSLSEETAFISSQEMQERWSDVLFDCYDDIAVMTSASATLAAQQQRFLGDEQVQSLMELSHRATRVVFRWYTELDPSFAMLSSTSGPKRSRSRSESVLRSSGQQRVGEDNKEMQKKRKDLLLDPPAVLEETPEKLNQAMDWYHNYFNPSLRQGKAL